MKRTDITYGQLEKVLRSLGFICRPGNNDPPGRIYEHQQTGAIGEQPRERLLRAIRIVLGGAVRQHQPGEIGRADLPDLLQEKPWGLFSR